MTGYGKASGSFEDKKISVEIRSLNSKSMDLYTRIASPYREKELEIRQYVTNALDRGKVELNIQIESIGVSKSVEINKVLAQAYYQDLKETNIAINDSESLSVSQLISIIKAPKALIIIDTCRKVLDEEYSSFSGPEYLSFKSTLNQPNSSEKYMQIISESTDGISIAYACSVGEISNDTELGGDYTYSLLKTSLEWYENQNNESVLSINGANDLAQQYLKIKSNFDQNPKIITINNKEENLNFPFAIKLNSL
jgi:hypothetical protein